MCSDFGCVVWIKKMYMILDAPEYIFCSLNNCLTKVSLYILYPVSCQAVFLKGGGKHARQDSQAHTH